MIVDVKLGGRYLARTVVSSGMCKFCHEVIVWATTPNGKFIPLQIEEVEPGVMEVHFGNCAERKSRRRYRRATEQRPVTQTKAAGIEMTETIWRQLIRLVHPDKHYGGPDERLANDLTGQPEAAKPAPVKPNPYERLMSKIDEANAARNKSQQPEEGGTDGTN